MTAHERHHLIIRTDHSHRHHLLRRQVMTTVGVAVAGLKDLGALVPVLEGLGAKHKPYATRSTPTAPPPPAPPPRGPGERSAQRECMWGKRSSK